MKRYDVEIVVSMGEIEAVNEDDAAYQAAQLFATTDSRELLLDVEINVKEIEKREKEQRC